MNRTTSLLGALLLFACFAGHSRSQAADFDCAGSSSRVERRICADETLARLDDDLARLYRRGNELAPGLLRSSQRRWLAERDACTSDPCIAQVYRKRIQALSEWTAGRGAMAPAREPGGICAYVSSRANRGTLNDVALMRAPDDSAVPAVLAGASVVSQDVLDMKGDGHPLRVFIVSEGSAHTQSVLFFDAASQPVEFATASDDDWESNSLRWASEQMLVRYDDKIYLIGKSDEYLHYVARVYPDNVLRVECQFDRASKPFVRLAYASQPEVCRAVADERVDYVPFDRLHGITAEEFRGAGIRETHPSEMAAEVDVDNDGKPELVVAATLTSGAGPGCDRSTLVMLDATRTGFAATPSAGLLFEVGNTCGGTSVRPFRFRGHTYLEHRYSDLYPQNVHAVVELAGGAVQAICRFDVRIVNVVLSRLQVKVSEARSHGKESIDYALERHDREFLDLLLKDGFDVNRVVRDETVLHWAVRANNDDALDLLLAHGADPNLKTRSLSPLVNAASRGSARAVRSLLRYGAALRGDEVSFALGSSEDTTKLEILLEAGAKPSPTHVELARRYYPNRTDLIQFLERALAHKE